MSMRSALSEETPVRSALKQAVQYGLGLFVAGFMANSYVQTEIRAVKDEATRQVVEARADFARQLAETVTRERERNDYLFQRRGNR